MQPIKKYIDSPKFMNNTLSRNQNVSFMTVLGFVFLIAMLIGVSFISGAMTALWPGFTARLAPIILFFIVIVVALVNKSEQILESNTLQLWSGFLLAVMALWPTYFILKFGALPSLDGRKIITALSILATLYLVISRKPVARRLFNELSGPFRIQSMLIVSYIVWRIASCFGSETIIFSLIQIFWEIFFYYSLYFIGGLFFNQIAIQQWMIRIFMLLAIVVSLYAGIEWILKKNILLHFAPTNKEFAAFNLALSIERIRDGFFRAQSTFEHPLLLAEYSAMAVSVSLAAFLWGERTKTFRFLTVMTWTLASIAAILSGSRSGLLNIFTANALIFSLWLFSSKQILSKAQQFYRKSLFFFSIVTSITVALPIILVLIEGQSRIQKTSTLARMQMLQMGWDSIYQHPALGIGPGYAGVAAGIKTGSGVSTLDSYFLAIAIESGIPALLLVLLCLLYPAWILFNQLMRGGQDQAVYFAAVLGCIVVTLITHIVLWMPYNLVFIYLLTGSALASIALNRSEASQNPVIIRDNLTLPSY